MEAVFSAGIGAERTMLLGFSQGACLSLEFAARHAARYRGIAGLSGGLIGPDGTPREYSGGFDGAPVFLGCSDVDAHIPATRVRESALVASCLGFALLALAAVLLFVHSFGFGVDLAGQRRIVELAGVPILALGLLAAMGAGPKMLQEKVLAILARNATAVMTNVPGPQTPLFLAGGRIESLMFWVPQSGDIGMGVSIISYNDGVQFGVVTDRGLCSDPEKLMARLGTEFEKLVLTTLMSPWPRDGELDPEVAAQAVVA